MSLKQFVRTHQRIYKASLFLRGKPTNLRLLLPSDHVQLAQDWAKKLPNQFDLIIGIPRAGLLIADTLAMYFGVPWSTPVGFECGEVYFTHDAPMPEIKRILLVEDGINVGRELFSVASKFRKCYPDCKIYTSSLFVTANAAPLVDYFYKIPNGVEGWHDIVKGTAGNTIASDLDGVLCKNPNSNALLNPQAFTEWVHKAEPHIIPRFKLQAIITSRPSWVRDETEKWLNTNGVQYEQLIMLNDKGIARKNNDSIIHKTEHIKKLRPDRFWESSFYEAMKINEKTGVPTYCADEEVVFGVVVK